jgi:prolyl-tRNA synthetase
MRGREFVMKDAYSFHVDDGSLDKTYPEMGRAYRRIFRRCGLTVIPVEADSGAMGGSGSEEFMVESEIGDNTLILCRECGYAANGEKASCAGDGPGPAGGGAAADAPAIETIATPAVRTIGELCAFLKTDARRFIKTLIYRVVNVEREIPGLAAAGGEAFVAAIIRGDLEVNEIKLAAALGAAEAALASDADVERITGAPVGFAGPVGLTAVPVIADESAAAMTDAVTGSLARDRHYAHVSYGRDFRAALVADIRAVKAGDRCPRCGGELYEKKGNELGHIFKLGRKYAAPMAVHYLDEEGRTQVPTMGCYGIGLDRALASVIEEHHDERGIVWPVSLAPYQAIIVPIKYAGAVREAADRLAADLAAARIETLLDDRNERPGVKFNDADLIGIPYRIVVGEKNLAQSQVEVKRRSGDESRLTAAEGLAALVRGELEAEGLEGLAPPTGVC